MANALKADLKGKVVILKQSHFRIPEGDYRFRCEGGFGCHPYTVGTALFGRFLVDGEEARIDGYSDVERFATEEEVGHAPDLHAHRP